MYELDRFDFAIVWKKRSGKKKKMMKKVQKGQSAAAFAACLSTRLVPCCFDLPDCLPSYPFVLKNLLVIRTNI